MESVVELTPFGEFWQVTYNGSVLACAATRSGAVNAAAALLRRQLHDPDTVARMRFAGLELGELLAAEPMDPNWKQKGPRVEIELFEQAAAYLETELVPADEVALIGAFRIALSAEDFDKALECLVELGDLQNCANPFWQTLERLVPSVWSTHHLVDLRKKWQREALIATIQSNRSADF